jgi:hypothetical protein
LCTLVEDMNYWWYALWMMKWTICGIVWFCDVLFGDIYAYIILDLLIIVIDVTKTSKTLAKILSD